MKSCVLGPDQACSDTRMLLAHNNDSYSGTELKKEQRRQE